MIKKSFRAYNTVSQKENAKPYMYYIMAVVAFVATGIMIYLGMK
ncbi:hypothetical protein I250019C1_17120 [Faecalibacterium sp. i25-0019-C1]